MAGPFIPMLRVGYPAVFDVELFNGFPKGVELIPLPDSLDLEIDIDVWIPDPYSTRAVKVWSHLRGVRLVLSTMAGTEWIPALVGPHVTICNARGAHNISTAEWTVASSLAMLNTFRSISTFSATACGSAVSRPARSMPASPEMRARCILP